MEIEKKFKIDNSIIAELILMQATPVRIEQAYIVSDSNTFIRVRIRQKNEKKAILTIKRNTNDPKKRHEYETYIDISMAENMINELCDGIVIRKARYMYQINDRDICFIDIFEDGDALCEIETDAEILSLPKWIKEEVTDNEEYLNYNFKKWLDKYNKRKLKNDQK